MSYNLPDLKKADVKGRRIFLRLDLDVPLCKYEIEDETRLLAGLPTVQYLLEQGVKVIIGGHLGRPENKYQISNIKFQISNGDRVFSLEPVAAWFFSKLKPETSNLEPIKIGDFDGWKISDDLFLLENLRFYEGEESNNPEFAKKLASPADIYVNDAFAMCHRDHASITGIPRLLAHFAGFRLQKEVSEMSSLLENPLRPLVVIIGGAKIETKLPLVLKMYKISDYVLVGGKIAQKKEDLAAACERTTHKCIALMIAKLNEDGTDLSDEDINSFIPVIQKAKSIIWNGPMGLINLECRIRNQESGIMNQELGGQEFKEGETEKGTRIIAEAIANSDAYKIAGGGDTVEFLQKLKLTDKFNFVSTGGGAMLSFLSGEKLPGLEALITP